MLFLSGRSLGLVVAPDGSPLRGFGTLAPRPTVTWAAYDNNRYQLLASSQGICVTPVLFPRARWLPQYEQLLVPVT
jgi:hypothetical protein